jgi:AcrR family transcriptional regulator
MTPAAPAALGRPRSPEADEAIRVATLQLLAELGYGRMTMSGVAATAGVSTATLYRRWRSKVELVVGVLKANNEQRPVPDTGSLDGDCRAILHGIVDAVRESPVSSGAIMAALVGELGRNAELADAYRTSLLAPRRAAIAGLLARAASRGELRADLDYELVNDLLAGGIYSRLLISGQPVTHHVADQLADLVVRAISKPARDRR